MPGEAFEAMQVLELCDRFHCLPSHLEHESAGLLRMLAIEKLVRA